MVQQLQLRPNLNRFGLLIGAFFFWLSALFCTVSAADLLPIPEVAYVTDTAHLLTTEQKRSLEAKLAGFEEKYGSQIAVIIVPSTTASRSKTTHIASVTTGSWAERMSETVFS